MPRGIPNARASKEAPRIFTPIRAFAVSDRRVVIQPGMLVDENHPLYKKYPEKFREPHIQTRT